MEAMKSPQVLSWDAFYEDRPKKSTAFTPISLSGICWFNETSCPSSTALGRAGRERIKERRGKQGGHSISRLDTSGCRM
jgi:hypothetical protein